MNDLGIVVIGRNEGERLICCLQSLMTELTDINNRNIVYVDSGSTDDSVKTAKSLGVQVIELDSSRPFTAARGRNKGFQFLVEQHPNLKYIQFIDGDCELITGWLTAATEVLNTQPNTVAVCGWRCERYPERSIYNRICNVEWHQGDLGEISSFGGDVMIRTQALAQVGGYDENVIAAEDDELSVRLRQNQGTLLRLGQNCTWHDADMHSFFQWWQRAKRCGYAYAQVSQLHGAAPERKFVGAVRRTWLWGGIVPLSAILLAWPTQGISLVLLGKYPLTALSVTLKMWRRGFSVLDSFAWGVSCALSAFPSVLGMFKFYSDHWQNRKHEIIEYKKSSVKDKFSPYIGE